MEAAPIGQWGLKGLGADRSRMWVSCSSDARPYKVSTVSQSWVEEKEDEERSAQRRNRLVRLRCFAQATTCSAWQGLRAQVGLAVSKEHRAYISGSHRTGSGRRQRQFNPRQCATSPLRCTTIRELSLQPRSPIDFVLP